MTSIPVHFSESPGNVRYLPPTLGEHSIEVLVEAGYSASEAAQLSGRLSADDAYDPIDPETITKA